MDPFVLDFFRRYLKVANEYWKKIVIFFFFSFLGLTPCMVIPVQIITRKSHFLPYFDLFFDTKNLNIKFMVIESYTA